LKTVAVQVCVTINDRVLEQVPELDEGLGLADEGRGLFAWLRKGRSELGALRKRVQVEQPNGLPRGMASKLGGVLIARDRVELERVGVGEVVELAGSSDPMMRAA